MTRTPTTLTDRFDDAFLYASQKHRLQRKKGNDVPYIAHLLGVASIVLEAGGNEDQAVAALLHDVVEDQGGMPVLAEIEGKFGTRVAAIVRDCTDNLHDEEHKREWRERKELYLSNLRLHSPDSLLVAAADKLYNVRCTLRDHEAHGDAVFERFTGKKDGTLWYYRSLVPALKDVQPKWLLEELRSAVSQLEQRAGIEHATNA